METATTVNPHLSAKTGHIRTRRHTDGHVLANCKTVYTSSILVVASINIINILH